MRFEVIEVCCYEGYKCQERPISFRFKDKTFTIIEIVDRWHEGSTNSSIPPMDYFKVKTDAGETCIIRYNRLFDKWAIAIMDD